MLQEVATNSDRDVDFTTDSGMTTLIDVATGRGSLAISSVSTDQ